MPKKKKTSIADELQQFREIKRLAVIAMFADDLLLERLVLKGGNALDLVHQISTRSSQDIDFSMHGDFSKGEFDEIRRRIEATLLRTFADAGLVVFDFKMTEKPPNVTPDLADFWGGYEILFKLIDSQKLNRLGGDTDALRKNALQLGIGGTKFQIEISRHEYVADKEAQEFSGYRIYVYSAEMIVCEKLRAICQQMPEYSPIVKRSRPTAARARDFLDIHAIVTKYSIDLTSHLELLRQVFAAKKAPLSLLQLIPKYRSFHEEDFQAVKDTVNPGIELKSFDFYFDFVVSLVSGVDFDGQNPAGT